MQYISTRGGNVKVSSAQAIKQGIAEDGGLFVPEEIPLLTAEDFQQMKTMKYSEIAALIIGKFLTDYSASELTEFCDLAYGEEKFGEEPAPLIQLNSYNEREYILELWHGPTAAFKDMALQLLPHLMVAALEKTGEKREVCILTATSGDTGKAALEGFKDIPNTRVIVFYPSSGVSKAQWRQMVTTEGDNVEVVSVDGCFDDAQTGVKQIFADENLRQELDKKGVFLSSANSINWGRLVPQIAYYIASYVKLWQTEKIELGEPINVVVPTGNFGNILAAWYSMKMGLPINKLLCASNKNKVLSDFFRTGTYDRNRPFYKTNSPSMDILVSSNLERLLFEITDHKADVIKQWMSDLNSKGSYQVDNVTLKNMQGIFVGGFADELGISKAIREVYDRCDHAVDTHTAVAFNVYSRYFQRSSDHTKTIFVSTASPYKFADSVADSLFGQGYSKGRSEEVLWKELEEETSLPIPLGLQNLEEKPILHQRQILPEQMTATVVEILTQAKG